MLLNERAGGVWVFRREPAVTRELSKFGAESSEGIPFLAPEVVLLYKLPRFGDHDCRDFEVCRPALGEERRRWLERALRTVDPDHPWLATL